ncbi:MAG: hypothetical protein AAAB13_18245 [Pseudomonas sp.]
MQDRQRTPVRVIWRHKPGIGLEGVACALDELAKPEEHAKVVITFD